MAKKKNGLKELAKLILEMCNIGVTVGAEAGRIPTRVSRTGRKNYEVLGKSAAILAIVSILFPIPLVIFGMLGGASTAIAWISVFWAVWTAFLFLALFAPTAIPAVIADILFWEPPEGAKQRWLVGRFWWVAYWVFLVETVIGLYIAVFRLSRSPSMVPFVILAGIGLAMVAGIKKAGETFRKWATAFLALVLVVGTLSFVFPDAAKALLGDLREGVNKGGARTLKAAGHAASLDWLDEKPEAKEKPGWYPLCGENTGRTIKLERENASLNIELYPDCWSDWVSLPPSVSFRVDTDQAHEYLFWSGERFIVHDKEVSWMGMIPLSIFRLRGHGSVDIIIEVPEEGTEEDLEDENG